MGSSESSKLMKTTWSSPRMSLVSSLLSRRNPRLKSLHLHQLRKPLQRRMREKLRRRRRRRRRPLSKWLFLHQYEASATLGRTISVGKAEDVAEAQISATFITFLNTLSERSKLFLKLCTSRLTLGSESGKPGQVWAGP